MKMAKWSATTHKKSAITRSKSCEWTTHVLTITTARAQTLTKRLKMMPLQQARRRRMCKLDFTHRDYIGDGLERILEQVISGWQKARKRPVSKRSSSISLAKRP